uniref:Pre-mRNA-splicing factor CWC22 n=1 Tax=Tetraselmis sp. GSL018 TaxID=582737 RepID=A0A061QW61_9CHLO
MGRRRGSSSDSSEDTDGSLSSRDSRRNRRRNRRSRSPRRNSLSPAADAREARKSDGEDREEMHNRPRTQDTRRQDEDHGRGRDTSSGRRERREQDYSYRARGRWDERDDSREADRRRYQDRGSEGERYRDREDDRTRYGGRGEDRGRQRGRDSDDNRRGRREGEDDAGRDREARERERAPRGRGSSHYAPAAESSPPGRTADPRETSSPEKRRRHDSPQADGGKAAGAADKPGETEPPAPAAKKPQDPGKTGGVYIPPFKLAQMMRECEDKSSPEYQRMTWDALRKSINGLVNKVNASNIKHILPEMFSENLIRGRGLFCRSLMKSQMASPAFTAVYAALVSVINTKFPEIGELLLGRVILQFRRAYKRNDKNVCLAATKMIAHLVNQQVAHELIALEMLMLLLETPSDDSVEVAVGFVKEVGACLSELSPQGLHSVFERFRGILHEGEIDKRVQFMIEGLFAVRKAGFETSGHAAVPPELDLVEAEDQITHELSIDSEISANAGLDVFKVDPEYQQHEQEYEAIKKEILGEDEDEEDGSEGEEGSDEDSSDEEEDGVGDAKGPAATAAPTQQRITDATQTNLVNLRRTIYLTIMSSLDFEEAGHKLLKIQLAPGQEMELITMLIECCSQERTYLRYYGLLAQRFCYLNRTYQEIFEDAFQRQYALIHRLETGKLRNTAKLFAHLLGTDAISWAVLANIRLTEDDTTSSSRIFVKILFQELAENLGLVKLNERLNDPTCQEWFAGLFPKDMARNLRFSINFFTSIGLGGLTDASREYLKNIPKMIMQQKEESESSGSSDSESDSDSDSGTDSSGSDSGSSSGSESGSDSSSESESEEEPPPKKRSRSADRRRNRSETPKRRRRR